MYIPGGNILALASRVIRQQPVTWQAFVSRTRNATGQYANTYAAPVVIDGSFQPIDQKAYQQLGLDLAKNYANLYTTQVIRTVERDGSGDLLTYNSKLYQATSAIDWTGQDGWGAYMVVEVDTP